jgi:hypothetical protein
LSFELKNRVTNCKFSQPHLTLAFNEPVVNRTLKYTDTIPTSRSSFVDLYASSLCIKNNHHT